MRFREVFGKSRREYDVTSRPEKPDEILFQEATNASTFSVHVSALLLVFKQPAIRWSNAAPITKELIGVHQGDVLFLATNSAVSHELQILKSFTTTDKIDEDHFDDLLKSGSMRLDSIVAGIGLLWMMLLLLLIPMFLMLISNSNNPNEVALLRSPINLVVLAIAIPVVVVVQAWGIYRAYQIIRAAWVAGMVRRTFLRDFPREPEERFTDSVARSIKWIFLIAIIATVATLVLGTMQLPSRPNTLLPLAALILAALAVLFATTLALSTIWTFLIAAAVFGVFAFIPACRAIRRDSRRLSSLLDLVAIMLTCWMIAMVFYVPLFESLRKKSRTRPYVK